jgi:hypothetical protein
MGLLKKLGCHEKGSISKNSFLSLLLPLIGRRSRRMRELMGYTLIRPDEAGEG